MNKHNDALKSHAFFDWLVNYDIASAFKLPHAEHSEVDTLLQALFDDDFLVRGVQTMSLRQLRYEFVSTAIAALIKAKDCYQGQETRRAYANHFKKEGTKLRKSLDSFLRSIPAMDTEFHDLVDAEFHSKILPPELHDSFIMCSIALDKYSKNLSTHKAQRPAEWLANIFAQNIDRKWNEVVLANAKGSIQRKHELALALWRMMDFPIDVDRDANANYEDWIRERFRAIGNLPHEN